jgi:hypothetical protein
MVQLVISDRYHSREGLLKFLKERFGAHVNFNIIETDDGHFKFEAPENLTEVGPADTNQAQTRLISVIERMEVSHTAGRDLSPVKLMRGEIAAKRKAEIPCCQQ